MALLFLQQSELHLAWLFRAAGKPLKAGHIIWQHIDVRSGPSEQGKSSSSFRAVHGYVVQKQAISQLWVEVDVATWSIYSHGISDLRNKLDNIRAKDLGWEALRKPRHGLNKFKSESVDRQLKLVQSFNLQSLEPQSSIEASRSRDGLECESNQSRGHNSSKSRIYVLSRALLRLIERSGCWTHGGWATWHQMLDVQGYLLPVPYWHISSF